MDGRPVRAQCCVAWDACVRSMCGGAPSGRLWPLALRLRPRARVAEAVRGTVYTAIGVTAPPPPACGKRLLVVTFSFGDITIDGEPVAPQAGYSIKEKDHSRQGGMPSLTAHSRRPRWASNLIEVRGSDLSVREERLFRVCAPMSCQRHRMYGTVHPIRATTPWHVHVHVRCTSCTSRPYVRRLTYSHALS